MRGWFLIGLFGLLGACGETGPSEAELAAKKVERDCSKLYASLTKVLADELRKGGVKPEFGDKDGFVNECAAVALTEPQMKCLDPNLGGSEECKKELEPVAEKTKKLTEYLLEPMKKDKGAPSQVVE